MTIQISPNFSFTKERKTVREFVTSLKEMSESEEKFKQVLKMGVLAFKSICVAGKIVE
jgi:hypothetical protein